MNTNLFIAAGRLEGTARIEYAVYRILTTTTNPPPAPNAPTPSQRPNVQTPR